MDQCPVPTMYADVNISNHLATIDYANLGPADPREPNTVYWLAKQELWNVPEGVARTRLCMNCAHYDNSPETLQCISTGAQIKACDDWEDPATDSDNANVYFVSPDEDEDEKAVETYKPTSGMASAARRALEWRKEGKPGGTRVGLARAGQLVRGENLTESTVLRMYSFFSRHEVDKQAQGFSSGEEGYPSPGRVAWDLWGGDAGFTWSKSKRDKIMNARKE